MRGSTYTSQRAGTKSRPVNEATGRTYLLPAPYQGWNARGNLASMPPLQAIVMNNVFPGVQDVTVRKGSTNWCTGFAAAIQSLSVYQSPTASKLFAATNAGVYDATSAGAVGASVTACTSGKFISTNFSNSGGSFLVMVNGVDNLKLYDGATWTTVTGVSVPAITGIATTEFSFVSLHKKRLWFVQKSSMNLYYMPTDSIGGAAALFPVGALFKRGGSIAAIGSWTIDSGSGSDDRFVIVTTQGEIAIYAGTDPASSTTWALIGVYDVAQPLGNQPLLDFGGDLLYLSANGLIPLSKLAQAVTIDRSQQISFNIDGAFLDAATAFGTQFGWQMTVYKPANALVVNIPLSSNNLSYQFVMNTITKAWCSFSNWNASCFATLGSDLYFATNSAVVKAWTGNSDNSTPIIGQVAQAYNSLGFGGQKHITLAHPIVDSSAEGGMTLGLDADYYYYGGTTNYAFNFNAASLWDTGIWDTSIWGEDGASIRPTWLNIPAPPGYQHSIRMQFGSTVAQFKWTATRFVFQPAGIL